MRRDLYRTCFHEAAHATVAQRLGYAGTHFRIWRSPVGAQSGEGVAGQTYVFDAPSVEDGRVICLAGAIAELLLDGTEASSRVIHEWLVTGTIGLSDSDADGASGFSSHDTYRTIELVRQCWASIEAEVTSTLDELGVAADGDAGID